jgi:uncharacterized membrane protein YidH (DUF202 family)
MIQMLGKILFFAAAVGIVAFAFVVPLIRSVRKTATRPGLAVAGVVGVGLALVGVGAMPLVSGSGLRSLTLVIGVTAVVSALAVFAAGIRSK